MIALGVLLLVLGFIFGIPLLWEIGLAILVIGAVLFVLGSVGHPIGRRHYF